MMSPPRRRHSRRVRSDSAESLAKEALSPQLRISGQYLGVSLSEFQASRVIDSVPHHSEQDELFMSATSIESLKRSWRVVLARDARDGELRHQTEQIAGHLDEVLAELSRSLRDGTFRPAPLAQVRLPKKEEGDYRTLDIPSVRDRIVERALVDALGHRVDQAMSPCSYGYRLGLGVDDAIDHLTGLRDLGMVHVLRTDVEDFFPPRGVRLVVWWQFLRAWPARVAGVGIVGAQLFDQESLGVSHDAQEPVCRVRPDRGSPVRSGSGS